MRVDQKAAARAINDFLIALGFDPEREPLLRGTGERVAQAYLDEFCRGYCVEIDSLLKEHLLKGEADEVIVHQLSVTTMCPHHLLPASGHATVAYEPCGHLVGFGVIARVVDACSRRLALQEQIGQNVADALMKHLSPSWAACRLVMHHTCISATSEACAHANVETIALKGDCTEQKKQLVYQSLGVGR